MKTPKGCTEK